MKQGTVYLHLDFRFRDGDRANKYFIILNTPLLNEHFIPIITTTQQKWRPDREGCHFNDNVYVIRENFDFFHERTWVLFGVYDYYPISQELLADYVKREIILKKAELRKETIRAIINCVGRSEDISGLYWSMINR
ncbi:MAG: hypothetical protein ACOZF2_01695 [Thermodesulfobacteriota bacterium]